MIKFDIITIFPNIVEEYINTGIVGTAKGKGIVEINVHDLRKWTTDNHKTVDDTPCGGGPGMVLKIEPIYAAIQEFKQENTIVAITTPKGRKLEQKDLKNFSEKKAAAFLYKLEKQTAEMAMLCQKIIHITEEFEENI